MSEDKYNFEFFELWSWKISKKMGRQQRLTINRMLNAKEERTDLQNEEMLKNITESKEQYKIERKERMQRKKKREKYFINTKIMNYENTQETPSKGFSITREEITHFIQGLQSIVKGDFDPYVNKILFQSGTIKKTLQNEIETETAQIDAEMEAEIELEIEEKEKQKKAEEHSSWLQTLDKKLRKEAKNMEKEGWTPEEIQQAFRNKNR